MRLIDADVLPEISLFGTTEYINVNKAPTVKAIPLDKIKKAIEQIIDEKDFAYADFERYKVECLRQEWEDVYDSLPADDFRYGMERCLEILNRLIAESEE